MRPQAIDSRHAWPPLVAPRNGLLVLSGYGLAVSVWRGHLRFEDGAGRSRRRGVVHRATGGLERLVVLGHTGSVSLDAVRWLADVGAAYEQIDEDGRVLAAFGPRGTNRPSLIRAQAAAADKQAGIAITRRLLGEKLRRQAELLGGELASGERSSSAVELVNAAVRELELADSGLQLRLAEARAAAAYWSARAGLAVRFARRHEGAVPAHWRAFGVRSSPLTGGPRLAVDPANGLLNYACAVVESEASIAARAVGLDPGLGILHADQPNRDSLADDLMEPIRPLVDRFVVRMLAERRFAKTDFHETRLGVCRLTPPLAREIAEAAQALRPVVGAVARTWPGCSTRGHLERRIVLRPHCRAETGAKGAGVRRASD